MYQEIIDNLKPELDRAINYFKQETAKIRTSRPSPGLIEDIEVECFGKKMPLKSLATITMSGPREMIIQPWDISYVEPIERAIQRSPLGISPIGEKDRIRVAFPLLSQELRERFVRLLGEKSEEARQTVRHLRGKAWKETQEGFSEGEITEDDKFRAKDRLQELVDEYNGKIEEMREKKEKEIME